MDSRATKEMVICCSPVSSAEKCDAEPPAAVGAHGACTKRCTRRSEKACTRRSTQGVLLGATVRSPVAVGG